MIKRYKFEIYNNHLISLFAYMPLNAEITGDIEYGKKLAEESSKSTDSSNITIQILRFPETTFT